MDKKFEFINEPARRAFTALPGSIQRQFGHALAAVQLGQRPQGAFKDISASVGPGAIELIQNGSSAHRAVYCAKYLDTVFVLHAFTKTTQGVDRANMATAERRYKLMLERVADATKKSKKRPMR